MYAKKDPFPPLLSISIRLYSTKRKKDAKLADFLKAMVHNEYIKLQIDFMSIYYAISNQFRIENPLQETLELTVKLMRFSKNDPVAFEIFNEGLGYLTVSSKRKKGIALLEKAFKMSPDNPIYMVELLRIYQQQGNLKKVSSMGIFAKERMELLKDKAHAKIEFAKILQNFSSMRNDFEQIKKNYNLDSNSGGIAFLNTITLELAKYLKEEKNCLTSKNFSQAIDDCLQCMEWFSQIATVSYFALYHHIGDETNLAQLKAEIIQILGGEPEPLTEVQTPNFLSPQLRKEAWLKTIGFDVLSFKPINSLQNARYVHIDGDVGNDNPQTHAWLVKVTADQMDMSTQHELHGQAERAKIQEHLETQFGKDLTIIHQKKSSLVHIDIYIVPPTKERNYGLLISSGMSERPMHPPPNVWRWWGIDISKIPLESRGAFNCDYAELVIKLPPDWPLPKSELKKDEYFWVIEEIYHLINYVHKNNEWFWDGHTMRNRNDDSAPFASNTKLTGWLFLFPSKFLPKEFTMLKISPAKMICFLQLIPLYIEEIQYAMRHDTPALLKNFDEYNIKDHVNLKRPNVIKH